MTKHNAYLFLPLLQALVDGKNLQFQSGEFGNSRWDDFGETEEIGFYDDPQYYRIKPEPRTWEMWRNIESNDMFAAFNPSKEAMERYERITVQEVLK